MKCIEKSWKCTAFRQISTTYRLLLLKKEEAPSPNGAKEYWPLGLGGLLGFLINLEEGGCYFATNFFPFWI